MIKNRDRLDIWEEEYLLRADELEEKEKYSNVGYYSSVMEFRFWNNLLLSNSCKPNKIKLAKARRNQAKRDMELFESIFYYHLPKADRRKAAFARCELEWQGE